MIAPSHDSARRPGPPAAHPAMVKYWLPELLTEIEIERSAGQVAVEKVAQGDIAKLFKTQPKRRRGQSSS